MARKALGRGIRALIPEAEQETENQDPTELRLEQIDRGKFQPRQRMDPSRLEELASSIRRKGLLQPIVVRRSSEGYEVIAGERRLRAAKIAGLQSVPVLVRDVDDGEAAEIALVENVQREDLNPIEKAVAYQRLIEEFRLSQEDVSERVGCDRSSIANFLRLLQLPKDIQDLVSRGTLSMGHARSLLSIPDHTGQTEMARKAIADGLSVRALEQAVRKSLSRSVRKQKVRHSAGAAALTPDELDVQNRAQRHLGTRVRLRRAGKGGEVIIEFYSDDDLNRILKRMGVLT